MLSEDKKSQGWNVRNSLAIQKIASGMGTTETAKALGYSIVQVSRIKHSPKGQAELNRLLAESNEILAQSLPLLTSLAVDELKRLLSSSLIENRTKGLEMTLKYLMAPALKSVAKAKDSPIHSLIDLEYVSPNSEENQTPTDDGCI